MNRKQLIFLVGVLIVLGGIGRYAWLKKQTPYQSSRKGIGEKLVPEFPLNDIAQVAIIQATQQLTLAKSGDLWAVKERAGYPADFSKISDLLRKIWEMKVTKPVTVPESRLAALELIPPDKEGPGTRLEFKDAQGKTLQVLLLGAKHMRESSGDAQFGGGAWPDGRYIMVGNDPKSIALVSDPLTSAEPRPGDWINKDFFKVEKLKSVSVASTEATNSWALQRETESGSWNLLDTKPEESLDSTKVSSANYLLSSPSFNDIAVNPDPAELGLDQPRVATLTTFDDFTYTIKLGKSLPDDNFPMQVSVSATLPEQRTPAADEKEEDKERLDKEFKEKIDKLNEKLGKEKKYADWTYKISKWSVDFLLKNRQDLLAEKKEDTKESTATPNQPIPTATSLPVPVPRTPPSVQAEEMQPAIATPPQESPAPETNAPPAKPEEPPAPNPNPEGETPKPE